MPPAYGPALTAVHHQGFGDVAAAAARTLRGELSRAGTDTGLVVDLGCGSGILARLLTAAGYDVLGIDLSADMVARARVEAPAATFQVGSIHDARIPPCVAVAAVGEIVNYAFDARTDRAALADLLRGVHAALQPPGVLVFDVATPGRGGPQGRRQVFHDRPDWSLWTEVAEHDGGTRLTRDMVVFTRDGEVYRRVAEHHELHLYDPDDVEDLLRATGFEVGRRPSYDGLAPADGWVVFAARKPG